MTAGGRSGPGRLQVFLVATVAVVVTLGGCSLLLDLDPMNGHPCDDAGTCLPGWTCNAKDICVPAPGVSPDAGSCPTGQVHDPDGGSCVFDCASLACPSGDTCDPAQGCVTVTTGLGASCTSDSQCTFAAQACSDGTADCHCLFTSTQVGICVAVPHDPTDCTVCGDGACVKPSLPTAGAAGGGTAPQAICVPPGFQLCTGPGGCENPAEPVTCGLAFFGAGGSGTTAAPTGHFAACVVPEAGSAVDLGQACQGAGDCPTGLCLPAGMGQTRCSAPCTGDGDCATGMATCVRAWVTLLDGAGSAVSATDAVCGVGGTLGSTCDPTAQPNTWPCATDAPECVTNSQNSATVCTRGCASDGDCSSTTACAAPAAGAPTVCLAP